MLLPLPFLPRPPRPLPPPELLLTLARSPSPDLSRGAAASR